MSPVIVRSSDPVVVTLRTSQPIVEVVQEVREVVQLPPAVPEVVKQGIVGPRGVQGVPGAPGGTSEVRTASTMLGGHRLVRSTGAGTVGYADSSNASHGDDTVGMTLGAADAGAAVDVQRTGSVEFTGWAWTVGDPVFLGTDGLPTQVAPEPIDGAAFVQTIGHAESATVLNLHIDAPIYF